MNKSLALLDYLLAGGAQTVHSVVETENTVVFYEASALRSPAFLKWRKSARVWNFFQIRNSNGRFSSVEEPVAKSSKTLHSRVSLR